MNTPQPVVQKVAFAVVKSVPIPARTVPQAGPRTSKYPIDDFNEGEAFAVSVASAKEARRKQSQFSALAKKRNIKLVTRTILRDADNPGFEGVTVPFLAVWHDGAADAEQAPAEAQAEADEAADDTAETQDDTAEDVIEL